MKRGFVVCIATALTITACSSDGSGSSATLSPRLAAISVDDVPKAALSLEDMGKGWASFDVTAVEGCTKIGGKICVENVKGRVSKKTEVGFAQPEDKGGFVANTILLMAVESDARDAVGAFRSAARTRRWSQSFTATEVTYELSPLPFERQGDETLGYRILSTVRNQQSNQSSSRQIDYIVFRSGRVLSFLYVIKVDSGAVTRKSAEKVEALVTGAL